MGGKVSAGGWLRPTPFRWLVVIGIAAGGFFDGILLHQILQWHHLLSLVDGVDTLRRQVLWDGYFHAAMYVLGALGLAGFSFARRSGATPSRRRAVGAVLTGFGAWHVLDAVLSHWILGIHRIRTDVADPLAWDLAWLAAFGLAPLVLGWILSRARTGAPPGDLSVIGGGLGLIAAGLIAAQPAPGMAQVATVVFPADGSSDRAWRAIAASDSRLLWSDPEMSIVIVRSQRSRPWVFYGQGALLVAGGGLPAGCAGWSQRG